jgi:hypothetical protein
MCDVSCQQLWIEARCRSGRFTSGPRITGVVWQVPDVGVYPTYGGIHYAYSTLNVIGSTPAIIGSTRKDIGSTPNDFGRTPNIIGSTTMVRYLQRPRPNRPRHWECCTLLPTTSGALPRECTIPIVECTHLNGESPLGSVQSSPAGSPHWGMHTPQWGLPNVIGSI